MEPLRWGPPGVLNPQTCPWEPPAIHHLRLRASYPSAGGLPGRYYSSRLWFSVFAGLVSSALGQQSALWPHVSDRSKDSCWLLSFFDFLPASTQGCPAGPVHAGQDTGGVLVSPITSARDRWEFRDYLVELSLFKDKKAWRREGLRACPST